MRAEIIITYFLQIAFYFSHYLRLNFSYQIIFRQKNLPNIPFRVDNLSLVFIHSYSQHWNNYSDLFKTKTLNKIFKKSNFSFLSASGLIRMMNQGEHVELGLRLKQAILFLAQR